jgi:selenocysteine lyase/cysteine desulfurase
VTFSDVVDYFVWLGGEVSNQTDPRARIVVAGEAIHSHEKRLTDAMINSIGNIKGLKDMAEVDIVGGLDNPACEGLVCLTVKGQAAPDIVTKLRKRGIRTHTRKADHYSGNVLSPLGLDASVRVSMCHYNTETEVAQFLTAMREIVEGA